MKGKGGWDFNVDASASGQGASPAAKGVLQIVGPDGKPVSFVYEGKPQTEVTLSAPFTATFLVPKAKPGTYTIQARTTPVNPAAAPRSCEATVVVPSGQPSRAEPPAFPWPPPQWTEREDLPIELVRTDPKDTYDVVYRQILKALKAGEVKRFSVYTLPDDGFAVVTRLERIIDNADPLGGLKGPLRWLTDVEPPVTWSFTDILQRLFAAPDGRYRVIVIIVTTQRVYADVNATPKELPELANRSDRKLEPVVARASATRGANEPQPSLVALIYEFRKRKGYKPEFLGPAPAVGSTGKSATCHLVKAGLWKHLEGCEQ